MFFFDNFSTIGKIYNKLNVLEKDLTEMQQCLKNPYLRSRFNKASMQGVQHLKELSALVDNASDTVQLADFNFAGKKKPIAHHLFAISEYMKQLITEYTLQG